MKTPLFICAGFALAASPFASAAVLTFDSSTDFDNYFYKTPASGGAGLAWDPNGYVQRSGSVSGSSAALYNTSTTGGSGGSGGTALGTPLNKFQNFAMSVDFSMSCYDGANSFGFYNKMNDAGTAGVIVLFRLTDVTGYDSSGNPLPNPAPNPPPEDLRALPNPAGMADIRVATSTGNNAMTGGTGVGGMSTGTFGSTTGLGILLDTWYTFTLTAIDNGANINYTAKLFDKATGNQLGNAITFNVTQSALTAANGADFGQVGFRLNSIGGTLFGNPNNTKIDNFSIEEIAPIPEPSIVAMTALGLGALLFRRIRRRQFN